MLDDTAWTLSKTSHYQLGGFVKVILKKRKKGNVSCLTFLLNGDAGRLVRIVCTLGRCVL